MQKNKIDDELRNSSSNSSRLIRISNINKVSTSNYIESHKYHTKIVINRFLETFYQKTNKERERERERSNTCTHNFILVHLKLSYIWLVKTTLALLCTISKYLHNLLRLQFWNIQNNTKTLESRKNLNKAQQDSQLQTCNPTKQHPKTWETSNLDDDSP